MKTRAVVGRRIVEVRQERVHRGPGYAPGAVYNVLAIVLDDGTVLLPSVAEMDGDYAVVITAFRKARHDR